MKEIVIFRENYERDIYMERDSNIRIIKEIVTFKDNYERYSYIRREL